MRVFTFVIISICLVYSSCKSSQKQGKIDGVTSKKTTLTTDKSTTAGLKKSNTEKEKIEKQKPLVYEGTYKFVMMSFKGTLTISKEEGSYKGTLKFNRWGMGKKAELKRLSLKGKNIFFIRSIENQEEKVYFNASRFFKQEYYGTFSADGSVIRGYFLEEGRQTGWEARRISE